MSYQRPIIYKRAKYKNLYLLYIFRLMFLYCFADILQYNGIIYPPGSVEISYV